MKLYPDTKVYVLCPGNLQTGGPELCHQFASMLISLGVQAYVCYYKSLGTNVTFDEKNPVHDFYRKYHVPYVFEPEDKPHNILILPETTTYFLYQSRKIQFVIWWMSVDNYLVYCAKMFNSYLKNPLSKTLPKFFYFGKEDSNITHFVQSEYARQFLKLNGITDNKIYMVEDYLNQEFLNRAAHVDLSTKKNIVAYNPKKGFEITQCLINIAPDIDWRPIENMTPAQVQELLAKAKIYIDFGNHPGKDRIPREAALSSCVVITNKRGAAANAIDINIPAEFKFDLQATFQNIINKIREVFENFPVAYEKQVAYRKRIVDDKNRFANEIVKAFNINKVNRGGDCFSSRNQRRRLQISAKISKQIDCAEFYSR